MLQLRREFTTNKDICMCFSVNSCWLRYENVLFTNCLQVITQTLSLLNMRPSIVVMSSSTDTLTGNFNICDRVGNGGDVPASARSLDITFRIRCVITVCAYLTWFLIKNIKHDFWQFNCSLGLFLLYKTDMFSFMLNDSY